MDKWIAIPLIQHVLACREIDGMDDRNVVWPARSAMEAIRGELPGNIDVIVAVHGGWIATRVPTRNIPELLHRSRHE